MPRAWRTIPTRYATTVGDGTETVFPITHDLGHQDVQVQVRDAAGAYLAYGAGAGGWTATTDDADTVTVTFGTAPTADQYRVIVIG